MNHDIPSSLVHRRGVRASLLRLIPSVWPKTPHTAEIIIPAFRVPRTDKFEIGMTVLVSTQAFYPFQHPFVVQATVRWNIDCTGIPLTAFPVRVYGIRYRNTKQSDDERSDEAHKLPRNGQMRLLGMGSAPRFSEPGEAKEAHNNPYSHLYVLLYPPPEEFAAVYMPQFSKLWPYQKAGIEFLVSREHALLADDMGLGKTAQCSIAMHVLLRSERVRRALIICPRALVRQWQQEALHWASLTVRSVDGMPVERKRMWESFPGAIIATPQIVLNDIDVICKSHFDLVVCDDVAMLKNPGKITNAIRRIPRSRSWCLSGTPLENKPEDFVNVMQFVIPDLFSGYERQKAPGRFEIQERVRPYFPRRRKLDVLKDLPLKQLIGPIPLQMDGPQWEAYRCAELQQWQQLQQMGVQATKVHVFALINLLLQLCNYHEPTGHSTKAEEVRDQLDILFDSGDPTVKVIVFSRWVKTLEFLKRQWNDYAPQIYHGGLSPSARAELLNWFKNGAGRLLLMSTKAGSRGLNLQESSYVFHFDRTWNPVDEMQAEDRCWRMGQSRNVSVYRFMQIGTIEERMHQVLTHKKNQFDQYVDSMADDTDALAETKWSLDELIALMRPSAKT